ncbi:hypothetical protein [Nitrogeniibacter aestuarii]|uniref:hypothetical protein n=1 Tax=Nitrogeniibacter aestuarii TaxID=2815343 RepID=UPI001E621119|nr:hypothetical protein [Nitrogeniibacter aestuarii]
MKIHVHATVSSNSVRYFEYVRANYEGLSTGSIPVHYYAYCLDSASHKALDGSGIVDEAIALKFGRGSKGHAMSIDTAISRFVPGDINVISDTDITILMQDWDRVIVDLLTGENAVGVVATRLEGIGGFSTGDTKYQQYKNKPSTTWMAMSPDYDFSGLTVMPDKDNFIEVTTQELSDLYQLPIGFFVVKDTGWQVPSYLHNHQIPYLALDIVKPTSADAKALKGCNPYHDEFQLNGQPFLAHQRGSMKHRFRIDPLSVDFYNACDAYLGQPSWAVHPGAADRLRAKGQDLVNLAKQPIRALRDAIKS